MGSHGRDTRPQRPQKRVEDSQQLQGIAQSIQSSQRVLAELAEAFNSWDETRKSDTRANPPGYRKRNYSDQQGRRVHEEHPRSTITWKQNGIKHDTKNNRVRLSKGANHKQHPKAWEYILIEYETRPGVTVENLQQVRAVYDKAKQRWELHLVCKHEIESPTAPGTETAGIDLGSVSVTSPLSLLRTAPRKPTSTPAIA